MDTVINKANEKIAFLSNDKEAPRACDLREIAQIGYNSGMHKLEAEGLARGVAKGLSEGKLQLTGIF